ncbi:MAG: putative hydrolase [Bacteroidetes bacterium HLUCCA01]|nr:MAG: putative hydrolase [Bacteroidetes bacterium HLUCCA01]
MSVFSAKSNEERLFENEHFYIMNDGFPVSPGHLLIVSKREVADFFDLTMEEQSMLPETIREARKLIESGRMRLVGERPESGLEVLLDNPPDGYNIGMNCGTAAGQTIMHFHCHVIPRYTGDTPNPRGGIRHCIPGKGDY